MAALSAFRRGVDHRSTLPVTYQDHFSVLLRRQSFLFLSSYSLLHHVPFPRSTLLPRHLFFRRRSLNLSTPPPSSPFCLLFAFNLRFFFSFFSSFSCSSSSSLFPPHLTFDSGSTPPRRPLLSTTFSERRSSPIDSVDKNVHRKIA